MEIETQRGEVTGLRSHSWLVMGGDTYFCPTLLLPSGLLSMVKEMAPPSHLWPMGVLGVMAVTSYLMERTAVLLLPQFTCSGTRTASLYVPSAGSPTSLVPSGETQRAASPCLTTAAH